VQSHFHPKVGLEFETFLYCRITKTIPPILHPTLTISMQIWTNYETHIFRKRGGTYPRPDPLPWLHGQAPRCLADHFITSSASSAFCKPSPAHGRWEFSIVGPTVWNSLPDELRDPACGSDSFKQFLKTILFSLY